jgi:hypothetical protein
MKFKIIKTLLISFTLAVALLSCQKQNEPIVVSTNDYFNAVDKITQIMVHDIFSPPVASRVYVYANIAAYEIVAQNDSNYISMAGQFKELASISKIEKSAGLNYNLAAIIAHLEVSKKLVFSEKSLNNYKDSIYGIWKKQNLKEFKVSKKYRDYLLKYIGNNPNNKKKFNALYSLRSKIVHTGMKFKTENLWTELPQEEKDVEFINQMEVIILSKMSITNWLLINK